MKLRLQPGSLRLRLTEPEVQTLAAAGFLEESVAFGPGQGLRYRLELADISQTDCALTDALLRVRIPERAGRAWAASKEIAIGAVNTEDTVELIVERDMERTRKP